MTQIAKVMKYQLAFLTTKRKPVQTRVVNAARHREPTLPTISLLSTLVEL